MISVQSSASSASVYRQLTLTTNNLHAAIVRLTSRWCRTRELDGSDWTGLPESRLCAPITDLAVALENLSAANSRIPDLEDSQRMVIPGRKRVLQ